MNKTPLQELIEWVENDLKLVGYEHQQIIDKAKELMGEKQEAYIEVKNCSDCVFLVGDDMSDYVCTANIDNPYCIDYSIDAPPQCPLRKGHMIVKLKN